MKINKIEGMIAATFTPMAESGGLNLSKISDIINNLIDNNVRGVFVCGTTGEGLSMTQEERKVVAEAFVRESRKRLIVMVHVGHNCLENAKDLAAHAQSIGADCISAVSPTYFRINTVPLLADFMSVIAASAPELPFYYYNIPMLSGTTLNMVEFLYHASTIPNLAGIKYTASSIHEYQACLDFAESKFDLLYGMDEMLLSALSVGAKGYIGSTYNYIAHLYNPLFSAFHNNDLSTAGKLQLKVVEIVRLIVKYGGLPAQKHMMKLAGIDCGPVRLPLQKLSSEQQNALENELRNTDFFGKT